MYNPHRPNIDTDLLWKLTAVYAVAMALNLRFVPMTDFGLSANEAILRNPGTILNYWKPVRTTLLMAAFAFCLIRIWFFECIVWQWQTYEEAITKAFRVIITGQPYNQKEVQRLRSWFLSAASAQFLPLGLALLACIVIMFKGMTPADAQPTVFRTYAGSFIVTAAWTGFATSKITKAFVGARIAMIVEIVNEEYETANSTQDN